MRYCHSGITSTAIFQILGLLEKIDNSKTNFRQQIPQERRLVAVLHLKIYLIKSGLTDRQGRLGLFRHLQIYYQ